MGGQRRPIVGPRAGVKREKEGYERLLGELGTKVVAGT